VIEQNPNHGSPPRRRGGLRQVRAQDGRLRLTPAQAGRTRCSYARALVRAAHPRAGGADAPHVENVEPADGSPPRRRGGRRGCRAGTAGGRLTPAQAGRTHYRFNVSVMETAHPRAGGADGSDASRCDLWDGSPPRRRGGRPVRAEHRKGRRLTPAQAGRTSSARCPAPGSPAHPRAGGADPAGGELLCQPHGSPPRRRGGRRRGHLRHEGCRLTPAQAGRTSQARSRRAARTAHPRAGGADGPQRHGPDQRRGSPPRRRGGLASSLVAKAADRLTPAQAGRTRRSTDPS